MIGTSCAENPMNWPRRAGSPAQLSVFAGNRYWQGRKRRQATARQDRLGLGGNGVVCLHLKRLAVVDVDLLLRPRVDGVD